MNLSNSAAIFLLLIYRVLFLSRTNLRHVFTSKPVSVVGTGDSSWKSKLNKQYQHILVNGAIGYISSLDEKSIKTVFIGETMLLTDSELVQVEIERGFPAPHLRMKNDSFSNLTINNLVIFQGDSRNKSVNEIYSLLKKRNITILDKIIFISKLKIKALELLSFCLGSIVLPGSINPFKYRKCSTGVRTILLSTLYNMNVPINIVGINTLSGKISLPGNDDFKDNIFLSHHKEDDVAIKLLRKLNKIV